MSHHNTVFQPDFEIFRTISSFTKISSGHSLIIELIFIKFFRKIWEIGGQMSWYWCLAESLIRPKKNICVFTVTCQKNRGSVGRDSFFFFFLLSTKPEIVVPSSGIRFRYLIFENSGKMTNYAVFLPSLLSILTKS